MTAAIFVALYLWAGWVLWNGRANSPRKRRERAWMEHYIAEVVRQRRGN